MTDNCLIIQPGAVGDCVLTVPLVRLLLRCPRIERVDVMGHTERLAVLAGRTDVGTIHSLEMPGVHEFFADSDKFDPRAGLLAELFSDYEQVITFLADEKGNFQRNLQRFVGEVAAVELRPPSDWSGHAVEFFTQQVRRQLPDYQLPDGNDLLKGPLIRMSQADRLRGKELLAERNIEVDQGNVIAIHPGSGGQKKCWPLENFRQVARELRDRGYQVVMLLGPAEIDRWPGEVIAAIRSETPVIDNAEITDIAAVLSCCRGYLGNDSGITHLAAAVDIPTLAIFGASQPTHWRPLGERARVLLGAGGNRPCIRKVLTEAVDTYHL